MISKALLSFVAVSVAFAGKVQLLSPLPNQAEAYSVQLDAAGNIYLAGLLVPPSAKAPTDITDAFVAKLSPDGAHILYMTVISGSGGDAAHAIVLGPDNSAYVTGGTTSTDLPITKGAAQESFGEFNGGRTFVAKIDAAGSIAYLTYLGGTANNQGWGIASNAAGEVFVTGSVTGATSFPSSSGAPTGGFSGYIAKLDASGSKLLIADPGFGGSLVALDGQGNIYASGAVAGSPTVTAVLPTTPGAFQPSYSYRPCGDPEVQALCPQYQHVEKLDPTGKKLIFATYLTGSFGATPGGMAVDSDGNVILAGMTNSPEYPVTSGAFQTEYIAT